MKQLRKAGKTEEELARLFPELQEIELSAYERMLLSHFAALSNSRGSGFSGPMAITFIDIQAYCNVMDESLTPWEVDTIRAMDRVFLEENYKLENGKEEHGHPQSSHQSKHG